MAKLVQMALLLPACIVLFCTDWKKPWRQIPLPRQFLTIFLNTSTVCLVGYQVFVTLAAPGEWDFLSFFLWSRIVGSGLPVYEVASSQYIFSKLTLPITPTYEFIAEVVNVGPSNPPTALLWYRFWISDMPFGVAHIRWILLTVAFFFLCCFLLARSLDSDRRPAFLLLFPVVGLAPVTTSTVNLGQTTFVVMVLILAAWIDMKNHRSPVWVALSSLFKPFAAIFGLFFAANRRWLDLSLATAVGISALIASCFVMGFGQVSEYLRGGFADLAPTWLFTEPANQSLMAVILRWLDPQVSSGKTLSHPVFLVTSALLVFVTTSIGWFSKDHQTRLVFLSVLCLGLLVYPGSLFHYGFFLFLPWLFLASRAKRAGVSCIVLSLGYWAGIGLISYRTFLANVISWAVISTILLAGIVGVNAKYLSIFDDLPAPKSRK